MDENLAQHDVERLMTELRPRLHRYCARMVGSAIDGEDLVQETLAKAAEALPGGGTIERPESWLFRIAHNTALDALRRRRRQAAAPLDDHLDTIADHSAPADARVAATAGLATFLRLPPVPRSSVVLMDVLGHSLAETADILGVSVAAVKAGLHRGRARLRELAAVPDAPPPALSAAERERLRSYADRFNARDFDALRALLAEDVRLDLVNRTRLAGRQDVGLYFTRYAETSGWHFTAGLAEGRPDLLVGSADPSAPPRYVVLLDWKDGRIAAIRDFLYAPYAMADLRIAAA
jgi:RNA polymerase sigma-70 factor (ECF subfamily)